MQLSELLRDIPTLSCYQDAEVKAVGCDSRMNMKGTVYVCLSGTKWDGHRFARQAWEKGAAAVVARIPTGVPNEVLVEDTREVYAILCARMAGEPAHRLSMLAVTGTNGKTTVATLLQRLLCCHHRPCGLISTIDARYGNIIQEQDGTTPPPHQLHPLLDRMAQAGMQYVSMEASSHAMDQKRLFGIPFSVAVFTNLTQDHLDYHPSMVEYYEAKKKLFLQAQTALINADDPYGQKLLRELSGKTLRYSLQDPEADYYADQVVCSETGVSFLLHVKGESYPTRLGIPGQYSVYNALAVLGAADVCGIPLSTAAETLGKLDGVQGRSELIRTDRGFSVICDYAHTPDGLENILRATRQYITGRLIVVFGCGGDRDRTKRPLMGKIAASLADFCVITSDNPRTEAPGRIIADVLKGIPSFRQAIAIPDRRQAIRYALTRARPGDAVILAGKGHEQYQILGDKKLRFDERKLVQGILRSLDQAGG